MIGFSGRTFVLYQGFYLVSVFKGIDKIVVEEIEVVCDLFIEEVRSRKGTLDIDGWWMMR